MSAPEALPAEASVGVALGGATDWADWAIPSEGFDLGNWFLHFCLILAIVAAHVVFKPWQELPVFGLFSCQDVADLIEDASRQNQGLRPDRAPRNNRGTIGHVGGIGIVAKVDRLKGLPIPILKGYGVEYHLVDEI